MGIEQLKVELIDHMGNDYSPIRAAIVSNGHMDSSKYIDDQLNYKPAAHSLINFLARGCTSGDWATIQDSLVNRTAEETDEIEDTLNYVRQMPAHWTPFGHTAITVYVKAPIFVARQLGKHQVGFVWNEISRRYVDKEPEFYVPDTWRGRSADKKQGSSGVVPYRYQRYGDEFGTHNFSIDKVCLDEYNLMLAEGVAPEQARMVLPQSMLTEWYWTGNLYNFAKMFVSRTDPHTQKETQDIANMIGDVIQPLFPISWEALTA